MAMNPQIFQAARQNKSEAISDMGQMSRWLLAVIVSVILALASGIVSFTLAWSGRTTSAAYGFDLQQWGSAFQFLYCFSVYTRFIGTCSFSKSVPKNCCSTMQHFDMQKKSTGPSSKMLW